LRVAQTVAAQEVERRGLEATKADTTRGAQLVAESVGGAEIYSTLPEWFQQRLADRQRWSAVVPPREIGTAPLEGMRENPLTSSIFGRKPERSTDPKLINGTGASAGTVTAASGQKCIIQ